MTWQTVLEKKLNSSSQILLAQDASLLAQVLKLTNNS